MRTETLIDSQLPAHPSTRVGPVHGGHICPVKPGLTFRPPSDGEEDSLIVFISYKSDQASLRYFKLFVASKSAYLFFREMFCFILFPDT